LVYGALEKIVQQRFWTKKSQNWQHTRRQKYKSINTLFNAWIYDRAVRFRYIK
jgi:hypothetical protein